MRRSCDLCCVDNFDQTAGQEKIFTKAEGGRNYPGKFMLKELVRMCGFTLRLIT